MKTENFEFRAETIEVNLVEYIRLQERERILDALIAHGVDNWDGYGEAMRELYQDEDED